MTGSPIIETHLLSKQFGDAMVVRDLNLHIAPGRITGFLGRNGAGKTTTIKMLLGMTRPDSGTGHVLGYRIDHPRESVEMRRRVAYMPEDKQLYGYMTVRQMIAFTRALYPSWIPALEAKLLASYGLPRDRKVKALSKGMRTKLALLLSLARGSELLILDEPSEGLDPVAIEDLLQALIAAAAEGTTVFFSSHQLSEVERIADHICLIEEGPLLLDASMDEIRAGYRRIDAVFPDRAPEGEFDISGVEQIRVRGRQVSVLASRNAEAIVARAQFLDATSVDVTPVSLREIFLETVKLETVNLETVKEK